VKWQQFGVVVAAGIVGPVMLALAVGLRNI
jgi:hypothetical protein